MPKDEDIRHINVRRRNILFLVHRYLQDNAFYNTAEALKAEARLPEEFELCDNMDLDAVYLDYASYYQMKFGKFPRVLRNCKEPLKLELKSSRKKTKPRPLGMAAPPAEPVETMPPELVVTVTKLNTAQDSEVSEPNEWLPMLQEVDHGNSSCSSGCTELFRGQDWQQLIDLVRSTILQDKLKLHWSDMCGNGYAVQLVQEAVVAPLKHPTAFGNKVKPWKSVLLHGPPGTGKTLLAKILYAETSGQVTFFNITSSIVVSKWRGESEKILKVLFHQAQLCAPSVIFFDEIEALTSKRDRCTDHEASKRFKNELLQLLDGMEQQPAGVFVLATTNLPWDIDEAFLRRFEKKLLVQLPNESERRQLIGKMQPKGAGQQTSEMVQWSEHFTGDEIRLACKELSMQAVRRDIHGTGDAAPTELEVESAFKRIKPLCVKLMAKHTNWQQEHGS